MDPKINLQDETQIADADFINKNLAGRFILRDIRPEEAGQAADIEQICFPPHEACTREQMIERTKDVPELFLVAVDRETGRMAGFLNGMATDEEKFRDEFFKDTGLHKPEGKYVMLLGLDVLPEYRGHGLAREIMLQYQRRERAKGRKALILTCLDGKIEMYKRLGFTYCGLSASTWGDEPWNEMQCDLN